MPIYLYRVLDGKKNDELIEVEQSMMDPPLARHPITDEPIERVPNSTHLTLKHSDRTDKRILNPDHLQKHGFNVYEKDSSGLKYQRTIGKNGPGAL